jgi:hypothetical protein
MLINGVRVREKKQRLEVITDQSGALYLSMRFTYSTRFQPSL